MIHFIRIRVYIGLLDTWVPNRSCPDTKVQAYLFLHNLFLRKVLTIHRHWLPLYLKMCLKHHINSYPI